MANLADLILAAVPYRLPLHLQTYVPGVTPLSTDETVVAALVGYLVVIFGIQALMKNQSAYKLTTLFQVHNIFLTIGSGLLLVLMLEEILPVVWYKGFHAAICHESSWSPVRLFHSPYRPLLLSRLCRGWSSTT